MSTGTDSFWCVKSLKKVFVHGLVNFVPTVAYLFCLSLPAAFSQPRTKTFFGHCTQINVSLIMLANARASFNPFGVGAYQERSVTLSLSAPCIPLRRCVAHESLLHNFYEWLLWCEDLKANFVSEVKSIIYAIPQSRRKLKPSRF